MENLNKVVKEIKIVAKPSKRGGKNHFVRVELINGRSADVWCDKEVVELIQTCTELGVEPFKSFTLEKRTIDYAFFAGAGVSSFAAFASNNSTMVFVARGRK